jgi:TonB-dependent starch-binding outer membrane protein SusC
MPTLQNFALFWRRSLLSLLLFSITVALTFGQQRTITGKVTSETEGPLIGVNVVVLGTTTGAMTDINGTYTLTVPGPTAVLTFSYIGYTPQNITVGGQTKIDVLLAPALSALGEIVVTGYSSQRKKEITSSIANVTSEEFNKGNVNRAEQLIMGKVAGLSISRPGGNPNEGYNIRLRGLSTVGANTQPLVVVDGVIGASLENVDPNDIESMSVLKDGSAAAIYGTRGSSGVIIVTTKKGKKGTSVVEYNGYVTSEMVAKSTPVMTATEWRALSAELGAGTDFGYDTDWFKETTQNAISTVHNLSISGGSGNSSYRASVNYHDAKGVILNTGFQQLNGRINFTQKALNDKFTLDVNLGATDKTSQYGFADAFRYASVYNPTAPVRSDDAAYDIYDGYFQQVLYDYYNPVQILEENKNDGKDRLLLLALKGSYQIMKGLSVDAFYSRQNANYLRGRYYDKNSYWVGRDRNGLAARGFDINMTQLFETSARWTGDIAPSVNLNTVAGYSYQDFQYEGSSAEGGDFLTDAFSYNNLSAALDFANGIGDVSSYKNSEKLIAFFGLVNLNIKDLFFLTASARYEGSSRFGAENKWGLFPSIGGGVDLARFVNNDAVNVLKFRASYGVTGNRPEDSYRSLLRLGPSGNFFYNGEFVPGYAPVSNANPNLKWEKKSEIDAGFDFAMFGSRLYGSFDYYTRTTTDLLFEYEVPVPPNLFTRALVNLGEIKSSGLELSLTWDAVKKPDFTYSISLTPSYNLSNKLVSLSGTYNGAELKYGVRDLGGMGAPGQSAVPLVRAEEGKPIGQLLALVYKEIDEDGNLIFVDQNNDGTIDPLDRKIVGNGLPKILLGWGNNFTFKNWDLNIFFRGVFGHDLLNSYRGFYEVPQMIKSYNLPKTAKDMKNPVTGTYLNNSSGVLNSSHIEKADFVSLDNASLGYNFNLPKGGQFSRIRLYLAGNNLFFLTGYKGVDPNPRYGDIEDNNNPLVPGIDRRNTWFRTRSVTFGANIVF